MIFGLFLPQDFDILSRTDSREIEDERYEIDFPGASHGVQFHSIYEATVANPSEIRPCVKSHSEIEYVY